MPLLKSCNRIKSVTYKLKLANGYNNILDKTKA